MVELVVLEVVAETALEVVEHPVKEILEGQEVQTKVVVEVEVSPARVLQIVELPVEVAVMERQVLLQAVLSLTQVEAVVELIVLALEVQADQAEQEQEQQVLVRPEQVLPILVQAEAVLRKHLVQMTAEMVALA